jgi:flavin-dependent dehydrogenase
MASRAELQGVRYFLHCRVDNISIQSDKAVIIVNQAGKKYQFESRAVILASGFNSILAKNLGLGNPGYFTSGAQAEVDVDRIEEVEVYFNQNIAPGFFAWLVPSSPGRALAGLMTRSAPGLHLRKWVQHLVSLNKIKPVDPESLSIRYGGIPLNTISRTSGNRVLVVGDAAGQVKPTTGGGIYFGLICADLAVETLHNAILRDDLSSGFLLRYEVAWKQKLGRELRKEYFARKFYERLNNRQIDSLFSIMKSTNIIESLLHDKEVLFDWHGGLMLKVLKLGFKSQFNKLFHPH